MSSNGFLHIKNAHGWSVLQSFSKYSKYINAARGDIEEKLRLHIYHNPTYSFHLNLTFVSLEWVSVTFEYSIKLANINQLINLDLKQETENPKQKFNSLFADVDSQDFITVRRIQQAKTWSPFMMGALLSSKRFARVTFLVTFRGDAIGLCTLPPRVCVSHSSIKVLQTSF